MANDRFEVIVRILNPRHFELALNEEGRQVLMHSTKIVGQDVHHTGGRDHHAMDVVHVESESAAAGGSVAQVATTTSQRRTRMRIA